MAVIDLIKLTVYGGCLFEIAEVKANSVYQLSRLGAYLYYLVKYQCSDLSIIRSRRARKECDDCRDASLYYSRNC